MVSNSKSKDGSLKDAHAECAKYILESRVYSNIRLEKLVFSEIKFYVITIAYKCSVIFD